MKKLNNTLIFLISLLSLGYALKIDSLEAYDRLLPCLSIILVLFIPKIICKIFKIKIESKIEFIYIIFMFLAQFLGSIVNLYNYIWWYDLFIHFLSGMLTAILALVVMEWFGFSKEKNIWFNLLFMNSFTIMISSLWEFIEFGAFVFLKMDVQHHLTTGVFDTMEDMLIAFLGNIIISIFYLIKFKRKR